MERWRIRPDDCHFDSVCPFYDSKKNRCTNIKMAFRKKCIVWEALPVSNFDILIDLGVNRDDEWSREEVLQWREFGNLDGFSGS